MNLDMDEMYIDAEDNWRAEFEEEHGREPTEAEYQHFLSTIGDVVTDKLSDMVDAASEGW